MVVTCSYSKHINSPTSGEKGLQFYWIKAPNRFCVTLIASKNLSFSSFFHDIIVSTQLSIKPE